MPQKLISKWISVPASLVIAAVSILMIRFTSAPERERDAAYQNALIEPALTVFFKLQRQGLIRDSDSNLLEKLERKANDAQAKANQIHGTLKPGDVVATGRPGAMRPVWQNAEDKANGLRMEATKLRVALARKQGAALSTSSSASAWEDLQKVEDKLRFLHAEHAWFYRSPLQFGVVRVLIRIIAWAGIGLSGLVLAGLVMDWWSPREKYQTYNGVEMRASDVKRLERSQSEVVVRRRGIDYPRVRYGQEKGLKFAPNAPCPECGAAPGQYHGTWCDNEQCPACGDYVWPQCKCHST